MLLFIPIRTNSPVRRTPVVNYTLIGLNILVFLGTELLGARSDGFGEGVKDRFALTSHDLKLYQFFTYQFLHGDIWHLFGNMLFLWIFGNSVNSKMGNLSYLLFYLAAGVFAGAGFTLLSDGSCIGASGSIAGVTTAFLVLHPHTEVTAFYWLGFFIGTMPIKAILLILVKIILWDNIISPSLYGGAGVAYSAHLFGYFFGFVLCFMLLLLRALPRDQFDILAVAKRYYQRQQFRAAMADPNARAQAVYGTVARPVSVFTGRPIEDKPAAVDEESVRLRTEVAELVSKGDYTAAADAYERLIARDPEQCLPKRNLQTVANQLMTLGRYPQAAGAYERYLRAYPKDGDVMQIKFLLGIIYAKYLQRHEAAEKMFRECAAGLPDPQQRQQAGQWLETITGGLGGGPTPSEA